MPRIPRNPGSGKAPFNGPARGAGSGDWATGQASGGLRRFTPETARAAVAKRDCPEAQAIRDEKLAEVLNTYTAVMERADNPQAQIAAATRLAERVEGPIESKVQLGGKDGAPVVIERVIVDPKGARNADG